MDGAPEATKSRETQEGRKTQQARDPAGARMGPYVEACRGMQRHAEACRGMQMYIEVCRGMQRFKRREVDTTNAGGRGEGDAKGAGGESSTPLPRA
jgi:hypothetical protein